MTKARIQGDTHPIPPVDPDVMRGKVVFTDNTEQVLSCYRYGRAVHHFEMDGVRYIPARNVDWDAECEVD